MAEALIIFPVVALGIILGLYELFLIHRDENFRGSHWLGHGLHAIIFMFVALFIVLNIEFFFKIAGVAGWGWPVWLTNPWTFRVLVGLILNIKMHATSAVIKGKAFSGGVSGHLAEHWTHTLLISGLVILSPLYWPLIEPLIPAYLRF